MKLFGRLLENALDVEKCLIEEKEKNPLEDSPTNDFNRSKPPVPIEPSHYQNVQNFILLYIRKITFFLLTWNTSYIFERILRFSPDREFSILLSIVGKRNLFAVPSASGNPYKFGVYDSCRSLGESQASIFAIWIVGLMQCVFVCNVCSFNFTSA